MNDKDLPAAFGVADTFSMVGQRRVINGTSTRLILTVIATVLLAVAPLWPVKSSTDSQHHGFEIGAIIAAGLFLAAFLIELWILRRHPERVWYDGRAVAESVKTLAWRYAVGGMPYPSGQSNSAERFARDIRALGTDVESLRPAVASGGQATPWMLVLRARPLEERRDVYLRERVRNQQEWYARKATYNRRRATVWTITLLIAEVLGVILALLKGLAVVAIDLASVAAAVIASGAAWLAVKQHESIAAAYSIATKELGSVHLHLLDAIDENTWAEEVESAEEAISREHTMWRASRTTPSPTVPPDGASNG